MRSERAARAGMLCRRGERRFAVETAHIVARIEMVVAAANRRADQPIGEFEKGGVGAGHASRRIEDLAAATHAAQQAAADRAQEVEMMRSLPP